jgi:branched-chain amino acid transport system substrate-binding protein
MGSITVCGSHVVAAVYPLAAQHKVLITANADPEVFANATMYSWYRPAVSGTYADQYRAFLKWFRDNWHEGRAPRLAIIWETKAFGPLTYPYVNSFAQQLGYDVHSETLDIGSTDATTQLTRIRDFNPDVIAIIEPPAETGLVMKQSLELGVRPRAMILFVYSLFYGPLIQAYAPIINALEANGTNIYGVSAINYNLTNMPSSISNEIMAAYQRLNKTTDILTIIGTWAAWLVGIKTIQIQDTLPGGVYNLDNTKLALESIRGYTTEGLTAPLTYTAKDHRGPDAFWIYLVVPNRSPVPLLQVGYVDLSGVRPRFG